jgi:hypothetical protein
MLPTDFSLPRRVSKALGDEAAKQAARLAIVVRLF